MNFTGSQINNAVRKSIDRKHITLATDIETPTTVSFTAGEVNTYKVLPLNPNVISSNGFEAVTDGIKYIGTEQLKFSFNGVCTIGVGTVNTVVHLRLFVNDTAVPYSTSAVKLANDTDLSTANAACMVTLNTNDVIKVRVNSDKATTISAYHPQLTFIEI